MMSYKLKSRKLAVFMVWTALMLGSIVITKAFDPTMISWYGAISMMYIGGNVATKYIEGKKEL